MHQVVSKHVRVPIFRKVSFCCWFYLALAKVCSIIRYFSCREFFHRETMDGKWSENHENIGCHKEKYGMATKGFDDFKGSDR